MNSNITEEQFEDGYVYERIRMGDFEREIKGPADYVERRMNETFNYIMTHRSELPKHVEQEPTLLLPESETPSLADDGVFVKQEDIQPEKAENLAQVYRKTFAEGEPPNQYALNCFITRFYCNQHGRESLVLEDYKEAYRQLKREAVEEPEDIRSSLKNARTAKYLYSPEPGKFALTSKGERLLES